jgi:hypothetical protein
LELSRCFVLLPSSRRFARMVARVVKKQFQRFNNFDFNTHTVIIISGNYIEFNAPLPTNRRRTAHKPPTGRIYAT